MWPRNASVIRNTALHLGQDFRPSASNPNIGGEVTFDAWGSEGVDLCRLLLLPLFESNMWLGLWLNDGTVFTVFTSFIPSLLFSPGLFIVTKLVMLTILEELFWLLWLGCCTVTGPSDEGCDEGAVVEVLGVGLLCWVWDCGTELRMVRVAGMTVVNVLALGRTGTLLDGLIGVICENT